MSWLLFWLLFKVFLVGLCVASFVWPVAGQALGVILLFWLVAGPVRKQK